MMETCVRVASRDRSSLVEQASMSGGSLASHSNWRRMTRIPPTVRPIGENLSQPSKGPPNDAVGYHRYHNTGGILSLLSQGVYTHSG